MSMSSMDLERNIPYNNGITNSVNPVMEQVKWREAKNKKVP